MGKDKLRKFSEMEHFDRVFQPPFGDVFRNDYPLKGKWGKEVFHNTNPIILELGCGKGEYTVGLAQRFPEKNFIGVDIKGARMWKGAKFAHENSLENTAFLRTRIELIASFFGSGEIDEVWITFPDPQQKERRSKKRLTGSSFLNSYRSFVKENGLVHLKTDSSFLYGYTRDLVTFNQLEVVSDFPDLYGSGTAGDILSIKTYYEGIYTAEGIPIKYLSFRLPSGREIVETDHETDG